jgi:hypothetical protein
MDVAAGCSLRLVPATTASTAAAVRWVCAHDLRMRKMI